MNTDEPHPITRRHFARTLALPAGALMLGSALPAGGIALGTRESSAEFRNIKVTDASGKVLFESAVVK